MRLQMENLEIPGPDSTFSLATASKSYVLPEPGARLFCLIY